MKCWLLCVLILLLTCLFSADQRSRTNEYAHVPGLVSLTSPSNSESDMSISTTLTWNSADHYKTYVGTDGGNSRVNYLGI